MGKTLLIICLILSLMTGIGGCTVKPNETISSMDGSAESISASLPPVTEENSLAESLPNVSQEESTPTEEVEQPKTNPCMEFSASEYALDSTIVISYRKFFITRRK